MIYYLIENENGFETLVFEGTEKEVQFEKIRLEAKFSLGAFQDNEPWLQTKYYVLPEAKWTKPIGAIH